MTARARITQADMERALKSLKAAGFEHARVRMDLDNGVIDILVGEGAAPVKEDNPLDRLLLERNPWDDE